MKILSIGEFDPCGVTIEHRDALRARGFDYRMVVQSTYRIRGNDADWIWGYKGDPWQLLSFAREADVLQFYPGIGQPWSQRESVIPLFDADTQPWPKMGDWPHTLWSEINPSAARIYYFHGSRAAWANLDVYKKRYEGRLVWASTIDYAHELGALYMPPVLNPEIDRMSAVARQPGMPLVIAHAPTDPGICDTDTFTEICRRLGVVTIVCNRMQHDAVLLHKQRANAGFDHLRGCFSVNTLENAAIGLVPLVGINHEWAGAMSTLPLPPGPVIEDAASLEKAIRFLKDHHEATAEWQYQAIYWYQQLWRPAVIDRLVRIYGSMK